MAANFAKQLKQTTSEVKSARAEQERQESEKRRAREVRARQTQKAKVTEFIAEHLQGTIKELKTDAKKAASAGGDTVKKEWRIKRGELDPEPRGEIAKIRGLRDKIAEYFTGLNFTVDTLDYRDGYDERHYDGDEGEWFIRIPTDHMIGLSLGWGDPVSKEE